MANPNIGKEGENTQWKPGQSGNPKGRKPKLFKGILQDFKDRGYEVPDRKSTYDLMATLILLDQDELEALVADRSQPIMTIIVAKRLLSGKDSEMLAEIFDRNHGKSTNTISNPDGTLAPTIIIEGVYADKPGFRVNNKTTETDDMAEESSQEQS